LKLLFVSLKKLNSLTTSNSLIFIVFQNKEFLLSNLFPPTKKSHLQIFLFPLFVFGGYLIGIGSSFLIFDIVTSFQKCYIFSNIPIISCKNIKTTPFYTSVFYPGCSRKTRCAAASAYPAREQGQTTFCRRRRHPNPRRGSRGSLSGDAFSFSSPMDSASTSDLQEKDFSVESKHKTVFSSLT
jgi:hypothetical protein